jgi:O-antigen/teichoic acid export membrane protein
MFSDLWDDVRGIFHGRVRPRNMADIKGLLSDPFYSNSTYLVLSSLVSSGIGLVFWIFAAQIYSKEDIGLAAAIISLSGLALTVSKLGIDQSIIRFFPEGDKSKIFSTSLTIITGSALLIGAIFILTARFWSTTLVMNAFGSLLFILLVVLIAISVTTNSTFIALRRSRLSFIQNVVTGSRLVLIFPFFMLGAMGVLASWVVAYALSVLLSLYLLRLLRIGLKGIDLDFLRSSFTYSAGNYVSGLLVDASATILPILVLNVLGAGASADYYVAYSMALVVSVIPSAFCTSLFVEGSHGEKLLSTTKKTILVSILVLVPVIIVMYIGGGFFLGLFGKSYADEALELFRLLLIMNLLMVPFLVYVSIAKIRKDMRGLTIIGVFNSALLVGLSYLFMNLWGLAGIGYAWILTMILDAVAIIFLFRRMK